MAANAITRRRLKYGVFHSIVDLQAAINRFIKEHNIEPARSSGRPIPTKSLPPSGKGTKRWDRSTLMFACSRGERDK